MTDRAKDKLFAFPTENFPEKFKAQLAKYNLANDGYWETYAPNIDVAQNQVAKFIKIITSEIVDPKLLNGGIKSRKARMKHINWKDKRATTTQ